MRTGKVVLVMVAVALAGSAAPANAQISIGGPTAQAWVNAGALEGIAVTLTAIPANESPILYLGSGPNSVFDAPDRDGLNRGTLGLGVDNTLIKSGDDGVTSIPSEIGYYQNSAICGDGKALGQNCGDELRVGLDKLVSGGSVEVSLFYGGEQAGERLIVQLYRDGALVYEATEGPAGNGSFNDGCPSSCNPGKFTFDLGAVCWDEIRFLGDERIVADAADYLVEGISNLTLCANTCESELIAGGGNEASAIDVGSVVTTDNGDGTWTVAYNTTGPWELTELHLHMACDADDLPQNKGGNPQIGHFAYTAYPEPGTQAFVFPDDVEGLEAVVPLCGDFKTGFFPCSESNQFCDCPYVAAHAVVTNTAHCESFATLYGVERGSGDIYEINLVSGTANLIANITDPVPDNENSPNGLAFDATTGRLYFSATGATDSDLWFWNGEFQVYAGFVPGEVAGATFYDGEYYYVVNESDDLVKVQFDALGAVSAVVPVCEDFAGTPDNFRFGDIVITPDGSTLFGSTIGSGDPTVFFSVDLGTCDYTAISADGGDGSGLQLALGSNGALYGHSTGDGTYFEVDPATGATTLVLDDGELTGATENFTDLASGLQCIPPTETAWGFGTEFSGNSWAMYLDPCECIQPPAPECN